MSQFRFDEDDGRKSEGEILTTTQGLREVDLPAI